MCTECSHSSPPEIAAYPSFSCAPDSRSALTSVPSSTIPHSIRSISSYRYDAYRFDATSPAPILRLPFLLLAIVSSLDVARRGIGAGDGSPDFPIGTGRQPDHSAGTRSTRPRTVSTRATRTSIASPSRSVAPERSPCRIVPSSFSSHQSRPSAHPHPPDRQHALVRGLGAGDRTRRTLPPRSTP